MDIQEQLQNAIIEGNADQAKALTTQALEQKIAPLVIVKQIIAGAMKVVGDRFEKLEYYLSDLMLAGEAASAVTEVLSPLLANVKDPDTKQGVIVLGTVQGDIHDIGKNIVQVMLEAAGFKVVDLGIDVSAKKFITAAKENNADIIACSITMQPSAPYVEDLIRDLRDLNLRDQYKVLVGGATVDEDWAESIGADGYAPDASTAAKVAKTFIT